MFKVGDKVWSKARGYGEVVTILEGEYPVEVLFGEDLLTFTFEGNWEKNIKGSRDIILAVDKKEDAFESTTSIFNSGSNYLSLNYPEAYIQGLQLKIAQIERETKLSLCREEYTIDYCFSLLQQCQQSTLPFKEEISKVIKYINGTNNE